MPTTKQDLKEKLEYLFENFKTLKNLLSESDKQDFKFKELNNAFEDKKNLLKYFQEGKYQIAFIGSYSTGKSTFINALLNRDVLPEINEIATTAFPTYIYPISDNAEERAEIVYLSRQEREKLKEFYIEILRKELPDDAMNKDTIELKEIVKDRLENSDTKEGKNFESLKNLLENFETKVGESEKKNIDDIKDYVESKADSIIVKQADIYLNASVFSGRSDIVLVDLPGVDADNPRHLETTKRIAITEAKVHAFTIVSKADKIQIGETNEFVRALAKQTKQLEKAFWVLNRCDESESIEKIEISKRFFLENNAKSKISIKEERLFTTSALLYKNKETVFAKADKKEVMVTEAVDKFRETLKNYIENELEEEFLETNEKEFQSLKSKLIDFIKPFVGEYENMSDEDTNLHLEIEFVMDKYKEWNNKIQTKIENVLTELDNSLKELNFLDDEIINRLKEKIKKQLEQTNINDLSIKLPVDIASQSPEVIIRKLQNEVKLNNYIREEFNNAILEEGKLSEFMNQFDAIKQESDDELDSIFAEQFDNIKNTKDLKQRFEGICDILLTNYNSVYDNIIPLITDGVENRIRFRILNETEDKLKENTGEISYKNESGKEVVANNPNNKNRVIDFILNSNHRVQVLTILLNKLDLDIDFFFKAINNFTDYSKKLLKYKMYQYLEDIQSDCNSYIRICLSNYFKELCEALERLLQSKELEQKIRVSLTKQFRNDANLKNSIKDKHTKIIQMYKQLEKANE